MDKNVTDHNLIHLRNYIHGKIEFMAEEAIVKTVVHRTHLGKTFLLNTGTILKEYPTFQEYLKIIGKESK